MTARACASSAGDVQALVERIASRDSIRVLSMAHDKSFPKRDPIDLYRVELLDSSSCACTTTLAVQQLPQDRRMKALAKLGKAAKRLGAGSIALFGESAPEDLLLYSFPLDPKLARLPDAVSPNRASAKLAATVASVDIVRYVPARRCQLRWATANGDVYAKLYHDARGAAVFHAMQHLHGHLAKRGPSDVSTPAPIAYLAEWNALLQEAAPGVTLHALCAAGQADEGAFALSGRTLGAMHGADTTECARTHSAHDELRVAAQWLALAEQRDPSFRAIRLQLESIDFLADPKLSLQRTVVHRDCYDRQFLIEGERAAIIDLDEIALGEPELDAGNFLAHVELREIQGVIAPGAAKPYREAFLESYRSANRRGLDAPRLAFYLATALVRLAALYSMRPGQQHASDRLVERASVAITVALQPTAPDILP